MLLQITSILRAALRRRCARGALRRLPLLIIACFLTVPSFGQETGSIRGTVRNAETGRLLNNATVEIAETGQTTYTNEYGEYRFANVPSGDYTLNVRYVGFRESTLPVNVTPGSVAGGSIDLSSMRREAAEDGVYELEAFEVDGSEYNSNAVAQNERKISSNLKIVQHADALGEIAEGNIGEFLKNMPGVAIDYVAADARSIKLRGMGSEFTQVTVDGAQMASAGSSGKIRQFELEQVSLSNVEQLEVTKLPRADMPANSLGGSINLVSKNAFAQGGRQINYKAYLNFNSVEGFDLSGSPGWTPDRERRKTRPGFEINYSDVFIEDKLGASFTFSQSNQYNIQQRVVRGGTFRVLSDGSIQNDRLQVQDGPKFTFRQSAAANFDFKASESTVFTLRSQVNWYDSEFANRNYNWRINSTDTAASAGNRIEGTPHNSGSNIGGSHRNKFGNTYHVDLGAKHQFGDWRIDYGIWKSEATNHYRDDKRGYVETISSSNFMTNAGATRLVFDTPSAASPEVRVTAYDAAGNALPNYGLDLDDGRIVFLRHRPHDGVDRIDGLRLNISRDFQVGERKASLKFGAHRLAQNREARNRELQYRANAGSLAASVPLSTFRDQVYYDVEPGFGNEGFVWPSFIQANDYLEANRQYFTYNYAQDLSRQQGAFLDLEETVTSLYLMGQIDFAESKGLVTAGVRREKTDLSGMSPIVGEVYLDNLGLLAGDFTHTDNSYSTTHPSVHVRYNFTNNFIGRVGYANTIGRPNFANMFGPTSITGDESITVTTKNPNLRPRRSDNLDLTLEYYFGDTSMVSASLFRNDITDFEGEATEQLTQEIVDSLGLDISKPGGYTAQDVIVAPFTAGDAKVDGLELTWNQGLNFEFVPALLHGSSIYANGTFLDLEGNFEGTAYSNFTDDLPGFAKRTISYGVVLDAGPATLKFRWNIRGAESESTNITVAGQQMFRTHEERPTLDVTGDYKFNERLGLYFSARNIENNPYRRVYYFDRGAGSAETLLFEEQRFGVQWSVGVKGTF